MTSKSLSEQLAEITNPVPTFLDPEDDIYEETRARVAEPGDGDRSADEEAMPSRLRQHAAALLPEEDPRYAGRPVSRSLLAGCDAEDSPDESGGSDDPEEDGSDPPEEEDEEDGQLEAFRAKLNGAEAGTNGLSPDDGVETDSEEAADNLDEPASAEDEDEHEDAEPEGSDVAERSGTDEDEEDASGRPEEREEEEEDDVGDEQEGGVNMTSQTAGGDAQKGAAVKAQLSVWDQLLECRIKLQPCVQLCSQLPAPADWQPFWGGADASTAARLAEAAAAAGRLLRQLLKLQEALLSQFPETRRLATDGGAGGSQDAAADSASEDEAPAGGGQRKRRRPPASELTKRFAAYRPYRDETIRRWNDKTRLTGRGAAGAFAAFEQSTLKQIEQILSDRERLLRRTRLRRAGESPLGRPSGQPAPATDDKRDYDEEVFDDSDFYHQLLRELIERKTVDVTDPLALGRQWIQIQKLRSKIKKRVDTRASKGRKVRYEVYPKLVSFMASQRAGSMTDAARDELFGSLFGSRCRPAAGDGGAAWTTLNGVEPA